ncbi:hypothetical protein ACLB1N_20675 [Escherichia coli]
MTIAWPLEIAQDLRRLISLDTFSQLGKASVMMLTSKETILPLFGALILVGSASTRAAISPVFLNVRRRKSAK